MKHLTLFLAAALLLGCNNEKPVKASTEAIPTGVDIQAPDSITNTFTLPDSINTGLIIATYVEIDPESHTLLMYANADKKKAVLVRYLNNGTTSVDKLEVISETVLRSTLSKNEFHIHDSTVVFKMPNGHFENHYRTDANN